MTDYPKLINDYHAGLSDPKTDAPDQIKRFMALVHACAAGRELPAKVKELIGLAVAISTQCEGCIAYRAGAALRAGASRSEVGAVLGIATMMGCGPSSVYATQALRAYDALAAGTG